MTRLGGTITVRIARRRADALAQAILGALVLVPASREASVLSFAGMTDAEFDLWRDSCLRRLNRLAAHLTPRIGLRGRPRAAITTFHLQREDVEAFRDHVPVMAVPHRLRPVAKIIVAAIRKKTGRKPIIGARLRSHIKQKQSEFDRGYWADDKHLRALKRRSRSEKFRDHEDTAWLEEQREIKLNRDALAIIVGALRF